MMQLIPEQGHDADGGVGETNLHVVGITSYVFDDKTNATDILDNLLCPFVHLCW